MPTRLWLLPLRRQSPHRQGSPSTTPTSLTRSRYLILVYNIPGRTCARLEADTIIDIASHQRIAALKEASKSIEATQKIIANSDITVLSGDDSFTLAYLALGARGVVSVASNIVPELVKQLVDQFMAGDLQAARNTHFSLLPLVRALFTEANPIPLKAALESMGHADGTPRPPLTRAKQSTVKLVEAQLSKLVL
ncbi:MAG: dihydrodipicolinate synthase family protein [Planctomycetota bacterium]|nr:dihydrodipicolinate synthase family protein [Planctomycetota bacterium]